MQIIHYTDRAFPVESAKHNDGHLIVKCMEYLPYEQQVAGMDDPVLSKRLNTISFRDLSDSVLMVHWVNPRNAASLSEMVAKMDVRRAAMTRTCLVGMVGKSVRYRRKSQELQSMLVMLRALATVWLVSGMPEVETF